MLKGLILMVPGTKDWRTGLAEEGLSWALAEEKTEKGIWQALENLQAQPQEAICLVETDVQEQLAKSCGLVCAGFLNPEYPRECLRGCRILLEGLEEADRQFWEEVHARAMGIPVKVAETPRLILREAAMEDLQKLCALYGEEEREAYFPEWSEDAQELEHRFASYIQNMYGLYQFGMWVIIEKTTGKLIGRAGFGMAEYLDFTEVDLGYFVNRKYRRNGYAREACQAALLYAKERLAFREVSAYVYAENIASQALLAELGFEKKQEFDREGRKMYRWLLEL